MGVFKFEDETTSTVAPAILYKALVIDVDTLTPKVVDVIKSIEIVEGNGGAGSIKKVTYVEDGETKHVLHKIELVDVTNWVHNYSIVGGDGLPDTIEKISFEAKLSEGLNGGSVGKLSVTYFTKGDDAPSEEQLKKDKAKGDGLFKLTFWFSMPTPWMSADDLKSKLSCGDLIEFESEKFQHWAIFIDMHQGEAMICHYWNLDNEGFRIRYDTLNFTAQGRRARINNKYDGRPKTANMLNIFGSSPLTKQDDRTIKRTACEKVKSQRPPYNVITYNCEHFATECRLGEPRSDQVFGFDGSLAGHFVGLLHSASSGSSDCSCRVSRKSNDAIARSFASTQ